MSSTAWITDLPYHVEPESMKSYFITFDVIEPLEPKHYLENLTNSLLPQCYNRLTDMKGISMRHKSFTHRVFHFFDNEWRNERLQLDPYRDSTFFKSLSPKEIQSLQVKRFEPRPGFPVYSRGQLRPGSPGEIGIEVRFSEKLHLRRRNDIVNLVSALPVTQSEPPITSLQSICYESPRKPSYNMPFFNKKIPLPPSTQHSSPPTVRDTTQMGVSVSPLVAHK